MTQHEHVWLYEHGREHCLRCGVGSMAWIQPFKPSKLRVRRRIKSMPTVEDIRAQKSLGHWIEQPVWVAEADSLLEKIFKSQEGEA